MFLVAEPFDEHGLACPVHWFCLYRVFYGFLVYFMELQGMLGFLGNIGEF